MSAHSRRKGASGEREVVTLAGSHGLEASRTWETAQHADPAVRCCDVLVAGRPCQVKRCAGGHKALYDALASVEALFLRDDGRDWLAVLPAVALLDLIRDANQHCREISSVRQDLPSSVRREPAASGQEHSSPRRTRTGKFKSAPRSRISRAAVRLGRRSAEVRGLDRMQSDYDERGLAVYQFKSKSGEPPTEVAGNSQPEHSPHFKTREMSAVQSPPAPVAPETKQASICENETPAGPTTADTREEIFDPNYWQRLTDEQTALQSEENRREREAHLRLLNPHRARSG